MPRRLELSDKGLELMVYLAVHPEGVSGEQIAQALWPRKSVARGIELVHETTAQVNAAIAEQTGNPTPVIPVPGSAPRLPGLEPPRVQVNVLGEVCVELYGDDEPFPRE